MVVQDRLHIQPRAQILRLHRKRRVFALRQLHSRLAAERVDALAQTAHTAFHREIVDQCA